MTDIYFNTIKYTVLIAGYIREEYMERLKSARLLLQWVVIIALATTLGVGLLASLEPHPANTFSELQRH